MSQHDPADSFWQLWLTHFVDGSKIGRWTMPFRPCPTQLNSTNTASYPPMTSERIGGISVAQWMTSAAGLTAKSGPTFLSPRAATDVSFEGERAMKVRNQKGFTLIELLIVVAIIGIIA